MAGTRSPLAIVATLALFSFLPLSGFAQQAPLPPQDYEVESNEDVELLTRGPLHEAYAEQSLERPTHGLKAPRKPPERINEVPPELRPEGDDVVWIPGYWYWDSERNDFLWISGVWRKAPAGRVWAPGYWTEVDSEHYWVSGYWSTETADDPSVYQPEPPATLESGPSSPSPGDDHFWVPGCWQYIDQHYSWRPGFWEVADENRVWTPSHYVWTPRGCVYVGGYWDYPFHARGTLFCPLRFRRPVYRTVGYRYSPYYSIRAASAVLHLFIRPDCHHYYYGDYYGHHQRQRYVPWFKFHSIGRRYDPFYVRLKSMDRYGVDNIRRYRDWHGYFDRHADRRPPRVASAQREYAHRFAKSQFTSQNLLGRRLQETDAHADTAAPPLESDSTNSHVRRDSGNHRSTASSDTRSWRSAHYE